MTALTASLAARDKGNLHSRPLVALCMSLAVLHFSLLVCPGVPDAADRPASPAQLQGLRDQIAGLQGQLAAKEAELQAQNSKIADIKVKMLGLGALQDLNVGGPSTLGENLGMGGGRAALQFQLIAAESQRDAVAQQISSLQQQIAQVQATLTYWQNPIGTDLENERAGLRNLESQQPTKDDEDQLGRDIESRRQRIRELENLQQQFQQSSPGGQTTTGGASSGQSVQPQGSSYTTPTPGYGAPGAAAPPPPGSGGYYGYPSPHGTPSPQVPWEGLVPPSSGGGGGSPSGGG